MGLSLSARVNKTNLETQYGLERGQKAVVALPKGEARAKAVAKLGRSGRLQVVRGDA